MRLFLCVAFFFIAAPTFAQDNTLTPKEIADGWLLLFDGETDYGWKGEGIIKAKDGSISIQSADAKKSLARHAGQFQNFNLSFEYHVEGQTTGKGGKKGVRPPTANLTLRQKNDSQSIDLDGPIFDPEYPWVHIVGDIRGGNVSFCFTDGKISVRAAEAKFGAGTNFLEWNVPENSVLKIKNVKIKPLNLVPLFNTKDLTGWKEFPSKKSKFSVNAKGEINIKDGPGDLQTEAKYEDFILQLECISNGKNLNSGVFFRCRANEYQNGYEVQIRNQFTKEPTQEYTLEEYDPQTHKLLAKKKAKFTAVDYGTGAIYRRQPARKEVSKDGEWFTLTILAHKNHFMTWVNGIQVADFFDNRPPNDNARNGYRQEAGHISLQGHDPTTDLSFRNIRIAEIK